LNVWLRGAEIVGRLAHLGLVRAADLPLGRNRPLGRCRAAAAVLPL